ncbi:MAG TPA: HesA/MoeB/ThiF family protein [Gemmataceae bacterium]|nr:HesA/MoeB/ThiF family protein [Gemmataceae bacterium]
MAKPDEPLTPDERETYEWQMWVPGVGDVGQRKLKAASVLVTRAGGLGGLAAYELAAAGVGRIVLAHAGLIKRGDLNRQLLMTHAAIGTSRVECAARRLRDLNPQVEVVAVPENVSLANAERLVEMADVVVCCAPLFDERFALNEQCVRQNKPMIDCAMYELTGQVTTILPGKTACLACRVPEPPDSWRRQFPVFGAVSGAVGCLGAMEAIKLITGIGEPLADRLMTFDLRDMRFRTVRLSRRLDCTICGREYMSGVTR